MQIMAIMISSILLHNPSNFMVIVVTNLKTSNRIFCHSSQVLLLYLNTSLYLLLPKLWFDL